MPHPKALIREGRPVYGLAPAATNVERSEHGMKNATTRWRDCLVLARAIVALAKRWSIGAQGKQHADKCKPCAVNLISPRCMLL